jgi:hypothetical protein
MTVEETGAVLATCALYDNRKTDPHIVIMWHRMISDLAYQDCEDAVVAHYTETVERIMPAHIRDRVKAMRAGRLAREIAPAPSAELADEPGHYKAELKAGIRRIADGRQVRLAIAGPVREGPPPQEFTEARRTLGPALPKRDPGPPGLQELAQQQAAESRAARAAREPGAADWNTGESA